MKVNRETPVDPVTENENVTDTSRRDLIQACEEERDRIAEVLHNGVGQVLTGVSMKSKNLAERLEGVNPALAKDAKLQAELIRKALDQIRMISRGLIHTPILEGGLPESLKSLCQLTEQLTEVQCKCTIDPELPSITAEIAGHLYSVAQEAITNAIRHSGTASLNLELRRGSADIVMSIRDYGCGLQLEDGKIECGLKLMRNRIELLNGQFSWIDHQSEGFEVVIKLPLEICLESA